MAEDLNFQAFFNSRVREKGYTLERLSRTTGIAIKHLEKMSAGNLTGLPARPYFHGYLVKLGQVLEFDAEAWWEKLTAEQLVQSSGAADALPVNRFAQVPLNKGAVAAGIFGALLLAYFIFSFSSIFGLPTLTITSPAQSPVGVTTSDFTVAGRVENANTLTVNNTPVTIGENGLWRISLTLNAGLNTIEIRAKKFLGRERVEIVQISYEVPPGEELSLPPESAPREVTSTSPLPLE
jgi:hypothetical protein